MALSARNSVSPPRGVRKFPIDPGALKRIPIDSVDTSSSTQYGSILFNQRQSTDGSTETITCSSDDPSRPVLRLSSFVRSSSSPDDSRTAMQYRGVATTLTPDTYLLVFDPKSKSCKLATLSSAAAFNVSSSDPSSPDRQTSPKIPQAKLPLFQKQVAPEAGKNDKSTVDPSGDWLANLSIAQPDADNPYDFRHYIDDSSRVGPVSVSPPPRTRSPSPPTAGISRVLPSSAKIPRSHGGLSAVPPRPPLKKTGSASLLKPAPRLTGEKRGTGSQALRPSSAQSTTGKKVTTTTAVKSTGTSEKTGPKRAGPKTRKEPVKKRNGAVNEDDVFDAGLPFPARDTPTPIPAVEMDDSPKPSPTGQNEISEEEVLDLLNAADEDEEVDEPAEFEIRGPDNDNYTFEGVSSPIIPMLNLDRAQSDTSVIDLGTLDPNGLDESDDEVDGNFVGFDELFRETAEADDLVSMSDIPSQQTDLDTQMTTETRSNGIDEPGESLAVPSVSGTASYLDHDLVASLLASDGDPDPISLSVPQEEESDESEEE